MSKFLLTLLTSMSLISTATFAMEQNDETRLFAASTITFRNGVNVTDPSPLETITLFCCMGDINKKDFWEVISRFPNLTGLELLNTNVSDEWLSQLPNTGPSPLAGLTTLILRNNYYITDASMKQFTNLTTLWVPHSKLSDKSLQQFKNLTDLNLGFAANSITNESVKLLTKSNAEPSKQQYDHWCEPKATYKPY